MNHTDRPSPTNRPGPMKIIPVSFQNDDVRSMIDLLDQYQIRLYGLEKCNLESIYSLADSGAYLLGAYDDAQLIGIGAIKLFDEYAEIKRMYIADSHRRRGIGQDILTALEAYARQHNKNTVYLETGNLHEAALLLYKDLGYSRVERFGNYQPNSVSIYLSKKI